LFESIRRDEKTRQKKNEKEEKREKREKKNSQKKNIKKHNPKEINMFVSSLHFSNQIRKKDKNEKEESFMFIVRCVYHKFQIKHAIGKWIQEL